MTDLEQKWQQDIIDARLRKIADKKERRQVKHEIQSRAFKTIASRGQGLCCTTAQLRASSKLIADRYFKAMTDIH